MGEKLYETRRGRNTVGKEMTALELETLEYRKSRLRGKLKRLEQLLSGGKGSLLPLVRGGDGRWAEEKGRALVGELLEALDLVCQGGGEKGLSVTGAQREAVDRFLYCALRALEAPMPGRHWAGPLDGTWDGLLSLSRETEYRDRYSLYFGECYGGTSGFFALMDGMYAALTGESPAETISAGELAVMEERFREEIAAHRAMDGEWTPEDLAVFSEPADELDRAEREEEEDAVAVWAERFPEKECFCRGYLDLRRQFFAARAWTCLETGLEQMIDVYLYRQEASSFLTDETFFLAYGLLDRAEGELRDAVGEAQ